jgi:hypothetical protein
MARDNITYDDPLFLEKVPMNDEHLYVSLFHWNNETKGTEGDKIGIQCVYEKGAKGPIRKGRVGLPVSKTVVNGLIAALQKLEKELPDEE